MNLIKVVNDGPELVSSNTWELLPGKFFCSVNAGTIRVLAPDGYETRDMVKGCRHCILSRGAWPEMKQAEAVEILFEDGSDEPHALHLSLASFDMVPAEPEPGREWRLAVYVNSAGKPEKIFETLCHWRCVPEIPYLKPWG